MTEITPSADRVPAVLTHVGGIFFGFIPALIVYLVAKDDAWLKENARNALNFQITIAIAWVIAWILIFVLIGILLIKVIWAVDLIFSIIAAVKAYNGETYKYPVALQLVK
jgi:uncharacterized protein